MPPHLSVLPPEQRDLLARLGPVATSRSFYLAGGTAVALHLGHRQSVDFDWFRSSRLEDPLLLARELGETGLAVEPLSTAPGTLHVTMAGVRCSFLEYRYPLLADTVSWPELPCRAASLVDLACMKLAAVAQRGARKDFLDVFAILRAGMGLADMLSSYRRKYGVEDMGHLLAALVYFDDAEQDPMPVVFSRVDWEELKTALRGAVRDRARSDVP